MMSTSADAGARSEVPLRITIDELKALRESGEPIVIADSRKDASYQEDPRSAPGVVRISPDDAVRGAGARHLSQEATIAVFCS